MTSKDIMNMNNDELIARKNSINKNDLIQMIIMLRSQTGRETVDEADIISTALEKKFIERLDPFLEKFSALTDEVGRLKSKCKALESEIKEIKLTNESLSIHLTNEVTDRLNREKNIIVSGVEELWVDSNESRSNHDKDTCSEILQYLGLSSDETFDIRRLGIPNANRSRLIRIKFRNSEAKYAVLKNARILRQDDRFKNIYINIDKTKMQQEHDKKLRDELRNRRNLGERDIVLYRGEIIHRQDRQNFSNRS